MMLTEGRRQEQHLPNGLQWQMTLNPDFYNIEDVVETIDFTSYQWVNAVLRPSQCGYPFLPHPSVNSWTA